MKIFVSYSRRDADLAQHVNEYFEGSEHDIFTDVNDIQMGDIWSNIIENNISKCDIFVVIVTQASLRSIEIEKEVLWAQRENRKIIPCIHRDVRHAELKWDLARLQGIEFDDKYELARNLFSKVERSSPIIPQTQSQESPMPQNQEPPPTTPKRQSESSVPPAAIAASSIRSSPPLSYPQADSTNTNTNTSPPARSITSSTGESRHYYHNQEAIKERRSGINLKLLLPIIGVVAIVGAVVAFSFLGSTNQPEPVTPGNEPTTPPVPPTALHSNAIPIAGNQSVTTNMDTPVNIVLGASDNDTNDDLTANIVSTPSDGKLSDINQTTGFVTYTPDPSFVGDDQFTFKVNDGKADSSNTGTVKIAITSQQEESVTPSIVSNRPPIPNNQSVTTDMNTPIDITLGASDQDTDDDLTAKIISNPLHGSLGAVNQTSGVVLYSPTLGFTGNDEFTFKVNDGKVDSANNGTVKIAVK